MGKAHHYLGASGSGIVMKLMGNLLVAAQAVAPAESVAMAKQAGLEKEAELGVPLPAMSSNAEILALATGWGSGNRTRRRCTRG